MMKIVDIDSLKPPGEEVAIFQGFQHGAGVSFFLVEFSPGKGPARHRHPYDETFIILDGEIEAIVDGEARMVGGEKIVIIHADAWHEFKARSDKPVRMITLHPVPKMITEWA